MSWFHVMIDVECMGTKADSALVAVGAAMFDLEAETIGPVFNRPIHLQTSVDLGMRMYPDTVMWWLRQSDAARSAIVNSTYRIDVALADFRDWLVAEGDPSIRTWGNAARFDLGILEWAYSLLGEDAPWKFGCERCFRTIRCSNPLVEYDPTKRTSVHHNAVDDSLFQIEHLFKIKRERKKRGLHGIV